MTPLEHAPSLSLRAAAGGGRAGTKKEVASALKEWALETGAVQYSHMFQPLRVSDGRTQAA